MALAGSPPSRARPTATSGSLATATSLSVPNQGRRSVALAGLDSSHAVSTLILKRDGSGVITLAVVGLRALANEAGGH